MTVHTSISNQSRELNLDQKHILKFDKTSELVLNQTYSDEMIDNIVEKMINLFITNPEKIVYSEMNLCERLIICIILFKKYKLEMKVETTQDEFERILDSIRMKKSSKRSEEKLKFIFKRCLKYLLDEFSVKIKKKARLKNSKSLLQEFYKYYYIEIAKESNLSLAEFFPPNRSKSTRGASNKTLNLQYLAKLAKNPKILTSMVEYMTLSFEKEYLKELKISLRILITKITKIIKNEYNYLIKNPEKPCKIFEKNEINSLKTLFSNSMGDQVQKELITANPSKGLDKASRLLGEMKKTILKQKMKIPWTMKEIKEGIFFVKKKLNRIQNKHGLN
jgi:hypothetical protein